MFDYRSISITLLIFQFVQLSGTGSIDAGNFSSSSTAIPTAKATAAAVMDSRNESRIISIQVLPQWTVVNVDKSPVSNSSTPATATKYHATFIGSTMAITTSRIITSNSTAEKLAFEREDKNRSFNLIMKKKLRKKIRDQMGHAFFFDDDDDDDDDDNDDDDDDDEKDWDDGYNQEIYNKYDEEEIENEKPDQNTNANLENEQSEVESESQNEPPQEEYNESESEVETKPTIILRTRRKKTKRKRGKKHGLIKKNHFKKWKKFMLPLLIAYKLKFFTLVPLIFGILKLILATTSFAGFFFALFAISLTMKNRQQHQYPGA